MLSEIASCALAPAPPDVILVLVRDQQLDELLENVISAILELVRQRPLHGLVREVGDDRDLVCGREDLGEVRGRGQSHGNDANAAFAVARSVQHSGLEDDEWRCDGLFNLYLDGIRLILGNSRHCQEISGTHEEVAMERRHAQP